MSKKAKLGFLILGLAFLIGASSVQPSVGLYWTNNADPTTGGGVNAPLWQLLIRTDAPSLYYKSGASATSWTSLSGASSSQTASAFGYGWFGTGFDGACGFDGVANTVCGATRSGTTYLMQRDVFANNAVIAPGITVDPNGFRFFDTGTITGGGQISFVAGVGGSASGGGGGTAGGSRVGAITPGSNAGAPGGSQGGGGNTSGDQTVEPFPCTTAAQIDCHSIPTTCQGGPGGGNDGGFCQGKAGAISLVAANRGNTLYNLPYNLIGETNGNGAANPTAYAPTGGGGGGAGSVAAGCGGGGGGGASGGMVVVAAHAISGITIHADGGAGGAAQQTGCNNVGNQCAGGTQTQCSGGGGGGGAGGYAVVVIGTGSFPTVTANGGIGGAKPTGCVACTAGVTGAAGIVVELKLGT